MSNSILSDYINQKVKIVVLDGQRASVYTGTVIFIDETFFKFIDKFNQEYSFSISSLQKIVPLFNEVDE